MGLGGEIAVRLTLHACCGPCLIEPLDALRVEHDVEVLFANPNIVPAEEHERRLAVLLEHAERESVPVVVAPYAPERWARAVEGVGDDSSERCKRCFVLRLDMAAEHAARTGREAFTTTLTVSPYQDREAIREAGETAAARHGVRYVHVDFTDRYRSATARSRELGMYRQRYCGCPPSVAEAEETRRRLREERRRVREERRLRRGRAKDRQASEGAPDRLRGDTC